VASQKLKICGGNFQKRKKSVVVLCQVFRMVTIEIVINSTHVMSICAWLYCRYCIAFEVMLLFLVCTVQCLLVHVPVHIKKLGLRAAMVVNW